MIEAQLGCLSRGCAEFYKYYLTYELKENNYDSFWRKPERDLQSDW